MIAKKILSLPKLSPLVASLKHQKKKIVFTNGTFDILHLGHVTYLEKARAHGDVLIVGVNTDRSVKSYKGPTRPINHENDRLRVLAALESVSYVVLFSDPTPLQLILKIRPDVLVKGGDWKKNQIVGAHEVEGWGGKVKRISFVKNRSTTLVLKKLGIE
ncbi:MAG: D-glycero-beta-D-manno-heptose 1-phosphate adenylyltransferase [Candidatus Omnitrophica bacterium]|nr:D-glycero-beta-D-manno-heptose 1-phosphate adenylyltransferase [Candidatus Omnitrophota bacterium]